MSTLEDKNKKRVRKTKIQRAILETVKVSGLLTWTMLAPKTIILLKPFLKRSAENVEKSVSQARRRLLKNGLLEKDGDSVRLTKKGEIELELMQLGEIQILKTKKWDKKWRVLIFDVPEQKKNTRNKLRNTLIGIGCYKLQDSVWVTPYNCEDLITLLKTEYKVGKELIYIIADYIENDVFLRKYFKLPLEN